jgi:hypothetical protein
MFFENKIRQLRLAALFAEKLRFSGPAYQVFAAMPPHLWSERFGTGGTAARGRSGRTRKAQLFRK